MTPPPGLGDGISDQPLPASFGLEEAVETGTSVTVAPGASSWLLGSGREDAATAGGVGAATGATTSGAGVGAGAGDTTADLAATDTRARITVLEGWDRWAVAGTASSIFEATGVSVTEGESVRSRWGTEVAVS